MDKTSLARMLGRMEEAELVRREQDETDARVNRVNLAAKGHDLQDKVTVIRQQGFDRATQGLGVEEVRELKRMLNHILWNMSPEDP
jgi:DNA-binding MarR family transcriptional regulator